MAAHVIVLNSSARRALIKVTPTKHLSDVLGEACSKFNINPAQYGLKHQKKTVDLSLSFRLSGLSSGARLELVQLSKSPTVVSIALQLPDSESQGVPNNRLMDKFPSNTTLWLVLRKFEAGVAGSSRKFNLTARGAPQVQEGDSGSGRLFYEAPVLNIMGKELSSFTDLQKTLSQLGLNSGSALVRLSFSRTDRPLEDAMVEIDTYFKSVDGDQNTTRSSEGPSSAIDTPSTDAPVPIDDIPDVDDKDAMQCDVDDNTVIPSEQNVTQGGREQEQQSQDIQNQPTTPGKVTISSRSVTVFAPPSNTTPHSVQTPYNERDYLPTIEHAQWHQKRLNAASRPNRLAGDAELAAQESAAQERLAKINEIEVKIRFPDQSQAISKFTKEDTTQSLYAFARSCLDAPLADQQFSLFYFPALTAGASRVQAQVPASEDITLINGLKMSGRVLVNFVWDQNAALSARSAGGSVLRLELRQAAGKLQVKDVATEGDDEKVDDKSQVHKAQPSSSEGSKKKGGMPKWLKLPGKK
ncbi:hypothetical protein H112_06231 [Trichophyton rubrum D6]|nr:uncharacterized protein TERG_01603 [Trichophyton rubrum CBS 118892]EZF13865.1 hypothetical protein H100_06245 [Trichophyton rubrum MR850]EZF39598.1 hypothetical protein H102_06212 [Trichophyton rubrum CBS 100081]EZF50122.1 hypothetical protein H103_06237 [Trichophyton rubrum CBS 288.86]EZF60754.1 hypothetical protein H104_06224 [Trichophyton rubrum CBS 289.86]EZF71590.1 hypothetical protein H105_06251 [Trichophyton soudanense CBS 452.61]EZF82081.1 hypothetical protein H110_06233 [Trichophy